MSAAMYLGSKPSAAKSAFSKEFEGLEADTPSAICAATAWVSDFGFGCETTTSACIVFCLMLELNGDRAIDPLR